MTDTRPPLIDPSVSEPFNPRTAREIEQERLARKAALRSPADAVGAREATPAPDETPMEMANRLEAEKAYEFIMRKGLWREFSDAPRPAASPGAAREADAFLRWLALPHKVSTATKAKSDYWANQFGSACQRAHDILTKEAATALAQPATARKPL